MVALTYSISKDDYVRFYTYMMWDSPQNAPKRRRYYVRQVIPPLLFLLAFYYTGILERSTEFKLLIVVFLAGTTVMSLLSNRSNIQRNAEKIADDPANAPMFAQRTVQASDSGLLVTEPYTETRYRWQAFTRKLENDRYYYLFTDAMQAIIIPKKSFSDATSLDRFGKLLSQHLSLDAEIGHLVKH